MIQESDKVLGEIVARLASLSNQAEGKRRIKEILDSGLRALAIYQTTRNDRHVAPLLKTGGAEVFEFFAYASAKKFEHIAELLDGSVMPHLASDQQIKTWKAVVQEWRIENVKELQRIFPQEEKKEAGPEPKINVRPEKGIWLH